MCFQAVIGPRWRYELSECSALENIRNLQNIVFSLGGNKVNDTSKYDKMLNIQYIRQIKIQFLLTGWWRLYRLLIRNVLIIFLKRRIWFVDGVMWNMLLMFESLATSPVSASHEFTIVTPSIDSPRGDSPPELQGAPLISDKHGSILISSCGLEPFQSSQRGAAQRLLLLALLGQEVEAEWSRRRRRCFLYGLKDAAGEQVLAWSFGWWKH